MLKINTIVELTPDQLEMVSGGRNNDRDRDRNNGLNSGSASSNTRKTNTQVAQSMGMKEFIDGSRDVNHYGAAPNAGATAGHSTRRNPGNTTF